MSKHMMAQSINIQFNSDVSILGANDAQIHLSKPNPAFNAVHVRRSPFRVLSPK